MDILEKPVQSHDWTAEINCNRCKAKLGISAEDINYTRSYTDVDWEAFTARHRGYGSPPRKDYPESYHVYCAFCKDRVEVKNLPWSVQDHAQSKCRDREKKDNEALKEKEYATLKQDKTRNDRMGEILGFIAFCILLFLSYGSKAGWY